MLGRACRLRSSYLGIRDYFRRYNSTVAQSHELPVATVIQPDNSDPPSFTPLQQSRVYENDERYDWRGCATPPKRFQNEVVSIQKETKNKVQIHRVDADRATLEPGNAYYDAVTRYKEHFERLLQAEEETEEEALRRRLAEWSLARLEKDGFTLTGLSVFWLERNQFGRPVAAFTLGPGIVLPNDHKFGNGSQVLVSRLDPLQETPYRGSVVSSSPEQLRVSFPENYPHLASDDAPPPSTSTSASFGGENIWRLDLGRSNVAYERMRDAIAALHQDPALIPPAEFTQYESLDPTTGQVSTTEKKTECVMRGTFLRDVLLRTFQPGNAHEHRRLQAPDAEEYVAHDTLEHGSSLHADKGGGGGGAFADDERILSWATRYSRAGSEVVEVEGDPDLARLFGLNKSQVRAVATMLRERVSLVQGPPGTGKTKTIIAAVSLLKTHFRVPQPVMVATYTNAAVDNLVEGLAAAGLKPLRVGTSGSAGAGRKHSLESKLATHVDKGKLEWHVREEERCEGRVSALEGSVGVDERKLGSLSSSAAKGKVEERLGRKRKDLEGARVRLRRAQARRWAVWRGMVRDVVEGCDVICTTCLSACAPELRVVDFPVVFLDEASMSTEPASLIPLMKGCRHLALIGDHKQLPPVIASATAQSDGLAISLFERLTEEGVVPSTMLDTQYRMHPGISAFPSSEFYNLTLRDGDGLQLAPPVSTHLRSLSLPGLVGQGEGARTGTGPSVVFLDHQGNESAKDRSRVNRAEAAIVASVVEDLLLHNPHLKGSDIGIISPYAAQISLLTRLFNTDARYQARFEEVLGAKRALQLGAIEIRTVDGFEGREKDVVVFSTVRNNAGGYIGFLADRRRLNVGLTRARRGLFVVGSLRTLKDGRSGVVTAGVGMGVGERGMVGTGGKAAGKGAESWRRYARFVSERGLVVDLSGARLEEALYANLYAVRGVPFPSSVAKDAGLTVQIIDVV